jgi:hypothetical protein
LLEIVQLFNVTIANVASDLVAFPDQAGVSTAQPCPSGKSYAFKPSKNCNMLGRLCW